jgi:hypothetical protein
MKTPWSNLQPQPDEDRCVGITSDPTLLSPGGFDLVQQDWQQRLAGIERQIASLEARIEEAMIFEAEAQARLQMSFGKAIEQARERIKRYADVCGESRLLELDAEFEGRLIPLLRQSQTAIDDLERLMDSLRCKKVS